MASLFLIVGTAWAQVANLSELDNSKAYFLKNANDMGYAIWKSGNNLTLCGATSTYTEVLEENAGGSNWQIIKYQDQYYLYNVGAQKFAVTQGGPTYLTETPTAIGIKSVSKGFAFNTTGEWNHYMCASHQGHHSSAPVQHWSDTDNGSAWQIIENNDIASFSTQLNGATKVQEYFSNLVQLTFQYKLTGTNEILYTTQVMATKGSEYTVQAPDFTSVASVTIPGTIGGQTFTVPNTATTITVALNDEFPYERTTLVEGEIPADAAWYVMMQNSTQNDTKIWKYADALSTEKVQEYSDNHLWCFVGNPFDLKIYSKVAGGSKSLSSGTQPASMQTEATGWVAVKSDNEKTFAGHNPFCLQRKNVSGSYLNGYSFGYYSAKDGGSTIKGVRAYSLTVRYMCGGEELTDLNVSKVVLTGEAYTISKLDGYTISSCQVNGANAELVDGAYTFNVNSTTEVVVTLEQDIEATDLYALKSPSGTYFNFTAVTPTGGATTNASFQATPSFVYKKSDDKGIYFQSLADENKFIGYQTTGNYWITTTQKSYWTISEESGRVEFTRKQTVDGQEQTVRLGHDKNTNAGTGIFTNVGASCNKWQLIPAYPITIVYKDGEEVIRTVKAAAMIGESYAFDIVLNDGTLVSCTTDKGTATVENNRCTIDAVNGATTVTVTLTLPTVPFAPEVGKAYVLKVVGTDKYLDIRTLGNDDPNESGSNNISTSTKPYPIYFEQGQKGTWKMKNANGKYVGLYPGKDWDPVIGASSHDWTMDGSANNFTIARESGKYINYNTNNDNDKVAGKPLYCDKGTGLHFRLVDYNDVDFITGAGLGKEGAESPYVSIKEIDAEGTTTSIPTGMGWVLTIEVENPNGASHGKWGSSILATGKEPFPYKDKHNGFQLYLQSGTNDPKKLDVVFGNADHIVNNVSYIGDFSAVITYDGISKLQVKTTNANGDEETNNYEVTLPEISEFAYGLPTGINIKRLAIETIDREYTFAIGETPNDQEVAVTYNGEALAVGDIIVESKLNLDLFGATEIEGYTWNVIADKETSTLTLNYTEAEVLDLQAVKDLVNRIGGAGTADKFKFVHTPWLNSKQETFVLGSEEGKILIKGTTISAITTGLGWYLNHVAKINIAWNSLNEKTVSGAAYADLSNLPLPATEETHTSDAKYRYYLNTCTFGYSMTSWTWKRWQQEIDWMALHGINMPLQLVGMEEVWRKFLTMEDGSGNRKYGYTDAEAKAFVAGPAFIAWWAMNNLEGWGGTAAGSKSGYNNLPGAGGVQDNAWYARQKKLAKQILDAQRALGMQPVLPGWSGMVPTNFASKSGYATRGNGGNWAGDFVRPLLLNTSIGAEKYAEIAADYYACLEEVMGESQYYSMDPFHEGGGAGTMEDYKAIYAAMETAKPGSQWVIQQWQWSPTQKYSLTAVPAGKLVVLDLFSDGSPAFDSYNGYAPQDAVFCAIPNFGGRSGLMGRLQNVTDNYFTFKGKYASIKGIGTAPEAIEQTPVTYDLIYQLPWMNGQKPNVAAWVDNYAVARYGKDNAVVKEAWSLLRQGPLNYGADGIQGPVEDVWAARPNLDANKASSWGKTMNDAIGTYTKERHQMLIDAVYKLIDQEDELDLVDGSVYKSNYLYDIVEFGGGVMADYAYYLLKGIKEAKTAGNATLYEARRDAYLQLILDMDAFRGTNLNFRLGKWTQEARAAAAEVTGATTATPDWYEYNNARTILTTWSSPGTNLTDYSYRSWQGLLKDYYYKRWKYYFDNNCTDGEYKFFEWNWAHGKEHYVGQTGISNVDLTANQDGHTSKYTREPEGNTVELAKSMLAKYIIPVKYNDGTTYYAYRTFTTDLTGKTFNVISGSTADFTTCFNLPAGVTATITGSLVNSPATDITNVTLPAEGTYTATLTLSDGTVLSNFTVKVNAPLNGYYYVKHNDQPVFVRNHRASSSLWPWYSAGDKMIGHASGVTPTETEKIFLITPSQNGYTLSAQGKYMGVTALTTLTEHREHWDHIIFSEDKATAGQYVLEGADSYRLRCVNGNDNDYAYVGSYGGDPEIFGNDVKANAVNFSFVPVTSYPITVPDEGFTTLYLPFNVVLPEGVEAYDINDLSEEKLMTGNVMEMIADEGETLKAKTAVIIKAEPGRYQLQLTSDDANAKTSLAGSYLRGTLTDYVLPYNEEDPIKKFLINGDRYDAIRVRTTVHANTCWIEAEIDDTAIDLELKFIEVPAEEEGKSWKFKVRKSGKGIVITDCLVEQSGALVIESTYEVDGVDKNVIGISDDFLYGNEELTEITLPATLTDLGASVLDFMFEQSYVGDQKEGTAHPLQNTVLGASTWVMTVDVDIAKTAGNFNQFGSCLLATKSATLADYYDDGSMQLYLKKDHATLIFKYDNADDRYIFQATDAQGQPFAADKIKLTLDNDGAGTATVKAVFYKVNENGEITYTSEPQYRDISASDDAELNDFATVWSSLPEGFNVNVKFEKKSNQGLFVGCTKLTAIHVEEGSKSFHGCEHGVLYNSTKQHVLRFPEGGGEKDENGVRHFEVPYTVTRVNPGALHDVEAHVTFHSNPAILHVENHEGNMKATYHLSLEDDSDAEDGETYAVDFVSANNNTYQSARYKRAPLAEGKMGTIMLPFAPTNAMGKYDFFKLIGGEERCLVFSQVDELEPNTPYLYKLKDGFKDDATEDIFETSEEFTVETVAKYNPSDEKPGSYRALGALVNYYIETNLPSTENSIYYYLSASTGLFHRVTEKLNYRPYRAYFVVTPENPGQVAAAPARLSLRLLDGTTTDIDASLVEGMEAPEYYDLSGRRVLNPGSGVYIVNGKKVFIK